MLISYQGQWQPDITKLIMKSKFNFQLKCRNISKDASQLQTNNKIIHILELNNFWIN